MTDLIVQRMPDGTHRLSWPGHWAPCAVGRSGIRLDKREGDGATPVGAFPLRRVLYRPDKGPPPATVLPVQPIAEDDGWCDDPQHPAYNRPVRLPFSASHEKMWRDDDAYDLVVVLGHNDDPPVPFMGSAIFLHLVTVEPTGAFKPTAGCVAVTRAVLLGVLEIVTVETQLVVRAPATAQRPLGRFTI